MPYQIYAESKLRKLNLKITITRITLQYKKALWNVKLYVIQRNENENASINKVLAKSLKNIL